MSSSSTPAAGSTRWEEDEEEIRGLVWYPCGKTMRCEGNGDANAAAAAAAPPPDADATGARAGDEGNPPAAFNVAEACWGGG